MRKNAISIELNDKAKEIYKGLPREVHKGEWVSQAIIQYDCKAEPFTQEQEKRIREIIMEVLEVKK